MTSISKVNRRDFFKTGAIGAAGLALGFALPESNKLDAQFPPPPEKDPIDNLDDAFGPSTSQEEVDEGPLNIMGWVALVGAIAAALFVWATWDEAPGELFAQGIIKNNALR